LSIDEGVYTGIKISGTFLVMKIGGPESVVSGMISLGSDTLSEEGRFLLLVGT
jgi:hypothetical protein